MGSRESIRMPKSLLQMGSHNVYQKPANGGGLVIEICRFCFLILENTVLGLIAGHTYGKSSQYSGIWLECSEYDAPEWTYDHEDCYQETCFKLPL